MRLFTTISSLALIIAGGGGWTYETYGTAGERIHEAALEQAPRTMENEAGIEKGGNTNGEPLRSGDKGTDTGNHTATEGEGALQEQLGVGEIPTPDIQTRIARNRITLERRAAREQAAKEAEVRAASRDSAIDDTRAYGYLGSFSITAYTAGYESTQKKKGEPGYGITATGTYVTEGRTIAADWDVLPPGTVVQIEGLDGTYTVEDRGGGVDGSHIDLYIESLERAKAWGRQKRSVWVVKWGVAW